MSDFSPVDSLMQTLEICSDEASVPLLGWWVFVIQQNENDPKLSVMQSEAKAGRTAKRSHFKLPVKLVTNRSSLAERPKKGCFRMAGEGETFACWCRGKSLPVGVDQMDCPGSLVLAGPGSMLGMQQILRARHFSRRWG